MNIIILACNDVVIFDKKDAAGTLVDS